jgi:hypothetical protein
MRTYEIVNTDQGVCIHCLVCGGRSYHPEDVQDKLCPGCDATHAALAELHDCNTQED